MTIFDDEPRPAGPAHQIGQDLSLLSVSELRDRIAALRAEIARLEADIETKSSTRSAAEAIFKRP